MVKWIRKTICCLQETHQLYEHRLKVKGWEIIFHATRNQNRAGVGILMSEQIDFNFKNFNKKQRRSLYDDKGVSLSREYNSCKYICT